MGKREKGTGEKRSGCKGIACTAETQTAKVPYEVRDHLPPPLFKEYCFVPLFPHLKFFVKFVSMERFKAKSRSLWRAN